jgi:polar amino acid transport system substrate-binding protein
MTTVALLAGCASAAPESDSSDPVAKFVSQGYIDVAVGSEVPYSYIETDGTLAGIDAEVASVVFKKLGITEVRGTNVPFSTMIPGIEANRYDAIAGNLFMKQSRCEVLAFSEPTTVVTYSFLTDKSLTTKPESLADLVDQGLSLVVQAGTLQDAAAQAAGLSGDRLLQVSDGISSIEALRSGRVDAILDGTIVLEELMSSPDEFDVSSTVPDLPVTGAGVAFRLEDADLRDAFNVALAELKESGEFSELSLKYGLDPEPVLAATSEQLCQTEG